MGGKTVILASPRGFCAGVRHAVEIAEAALLRRPHPVYGLKEIVHNRQVTEALERQGLRFVESLDEVPTGGTVLFSAHGVAPAVRRDAAARGLEVIDATCPFVTKVHEEVKRFAARGFTIALIGHRKHDEVVGVAGEAPDRVTVLENEAEADAFTPANPDRLAVITQTTLTVEETTRVLDALRRRFPGLQTPSKSDICYATTNRQEAVKRLAERVPFILVLGSLNSSNTRRLAEVATTRGAEVHLISAPGALDTLPLAGRAEIGLTAGASTPEDFIRSVLDHLRDQGFDRVEELEAARESIHFLLPPSLRA